MYSDFARYYDRLTDNVAYAERAAYFDSIIRSYLPEARLLLDLCCGTGSLSYAMADRGYDVTGVDISAEMLSEAMQKSGEETAHVLFLRQPMQKLDLYGTMDAVICALDSVNHVPPDLFRRTLERLRLFIMPGGLFLFDLNTTYKHRNILADNCFVLEREGLFCAWQNAPGPEDSVRIVLDFFEQQEDGSYGRSHEEFIEYAYPDSLLRPMLAEAGFEILAVYDGDSTDPLHPESERAVFVTRRLP